MGNAGRLGPPLETGGEWSTSAEVTRGAGAARAVRPCPLRRLVDDFGEILHDIEHAALGARGQRGTVPEGGQ